LRALEGRDSGKIVIGPTTVKQALMQWCDLTSPPRKGVLSVLAHYATDEQEKKRLLQLSDDKPQPYTYFIKDSQRTILEVLNEFPSAKVPFDHFLEVIPRLPPRYYSISSSLKEHPGQIHITAIVVSYQTPTRRTHLGVCTNWLAKQIPADGCFPTIPIFIHSSNFHLPSDPTTPIVMIGPGTGLAPFRGFLYERKHSHLQGHKGENILFFGCRSRSVDFLYEEELLRATSDGYLTHLLLAFSRDQSMKVYVQHKMLEFAEGLYNAIHNKGHLYVCGDARAMAKEVHKALVSVLTEVGKKTEEEAEKFLSNMQQNGQYLTDIWF